MKFAIGFTLFGIMTLTSMSATAQENVWTGAGSDNLWSTPTNWSLGLVPVNATTNPDAGWDDPTSPFYPLTPDTSDDYPLGNNYAHLSVDGTTTLIDSSIDAKAYAVRVGMYGATNTLEITGGHLQVGGILLPETTEQVGYFLDIGRGFNQTGNPNPLAKVHMSGGTLDTNFVLIPEQFIDPSKVDPYETAPLNGELDVTGGIINSYFMNLGQLVGNGTVNVSGDAVINLIQRPDVGFGAAGYLSFNRNWYDAAQQPIDSHGIVSFDVSDNAQVNIYGNAAEDIADPDETELMRYENYADLGMLTASGGTARPDIVLETIDNVRASQSELHNLLFQVTTTMTAS